MNATRAFAEAFFILVTANRSRTEGTFVTKTTTPKNKSGQQPGSMHIDKRARQILESHISEGPDDELLTTEQMANWFGCSVQWMEAARHKSTGPKYVVLSNRQIRYRREAGRAFLRKRERQGTGAR
jgi:hypothetical protein